MDSKAPWWDSYRKRKYKPRYLTIEMIIRKSLMETFMEYITCSSIAGIKQISNRNYSIMHRLFWLAIFIMTLSIVIYFLHFTWVSTLTRPLVVAGEASNYPIKDIGFPAVALCNTNRISRKAVLKRALETYPKLAKYNITFTQLAYLYADMGRLIDFDYDETRPHVKLMEAFSSRDFSDQTIELMKSLAPSCDEMLIKCEWGGEAVNCSSIFKVRRTVLGHCCAFNYVLDYESGDSPLGTIETVKTQVVPGVYNGLRVILDVMPEDYTYSLAYRAGFEVLIFDPYHYADMTGGRVLQRLVQPNQAEYFQLDSIKQIATAEVRKYPLSARKCLFRDERAKEFNNMYSYSACIIKCRIQSVQSLCKCTPYFLPTKANAQIPICTLTNLRCLNKYREKLQYLFPMDTDDTEGLEQEVEDSLWCPDCLPDCELTQHSTKSYKLPFLSFRSGLKSELVKGVNLTNKCIIAVYQSTSGGVLHRLDVVAYWFEIMSNIGGFAGMLMGIGIYTIVEIIYFTAIRLIQITYLNYCKYY